MGAAADSVWKQNPGAVEIIEELINDGRSAGEITEALNGQFDIVFTRSQIMGKVKRLKLKLRRGVLLEERRREPPPPPPPRPKPTPDRKVSRFNPMIKRQQAKPSFPPPAPRVSSHPGYRFADVPKNGCMFEITGDATPAKEFRFCGQPCFGGEAYCEAHFELTLAPSEYRQKLKSPKLTP